MMHIILTGLVHLHDLGVRVINDGLNEVRRSGLTQSVLFHTVAKRKIPSMKQVGLSYHWGDLKQR